MENTQAFSQGELFLTGLILAAVLGVVVLITGAVFFWLPHRALRLWWLPLIGAGVLLLAAAADAVLHPSREQLVLFPISLGVVVILLGGRIPRRVPRPQVRAPARQASTPILMLFGPLALTAPAVLFALAILVPAGQIAAAAMVALLMFGEATVVLVLLVRSRRQLW